MKWTIMQHVILSLSLTIIFANTIIAETYSENANAKITLTVVDEAGLPVENARVGVGYIELLWWDSKSTGLSGNSDSEGCFSASHNSSNSVGYRAEKDGYYQSFGEYRFKQIQNGHWEPWNPEVTVVMRKKENPVSMYARDTLLTKITIPVVDKEVGFDFVEFDWVAPHGKGKISDIYFILNGTYINERNYDMKLKLRFPGNFDGVQTLRQDIRQGSMLKLLRYAPDSGYQKEMIKFRTRQTDKKIEDNFDDLNNYYFRVRSEEKNNQLIRAMYGKIHGDIKFYPKSYSTSTIVFKYFLNPDYTRNMEFGSNLFKGINVGMD